MSNNLVPFSRLILAKSGAFSSTEYPNVPNSEEEILWRAVIDRAIHDLGSDNRKIREEAECWIDILNEDFIEVCRLANVFPPEVIEFIKRYSHILLPQTEYELDITILLRIKRKNNNDSNRLCKPLQRECDRPDR